MRPMAVLIGIIMGSAIALTVSLTLSAAVFLLLPEYWARLASERWPLIKGLLWAWSLTAVASLRSRGATAIRRSQAKPAELVTGQPNRCTPGQLPLRNTGQIPKIRMPLITHKTKLSSRAYHNQE